MIETKYEYVGYWPTDLDPNTKHEIKIKNVYEQTVNLDDQQLVIEIAYLGPVGEKHE